MPAERIVCLSDETTETLYVLGQEDRIVGISAHTVRPERARCEKPRIATFTTARIEEIVALRPDLVLAYSDIQADLAAELVREGLEVHVFNQRSVAGILRMIATLGELVGCHAQSAELIARLERGLEEIHRQAAHFPNRPKVYFEEWDDPMISGIGWVSELIELAGGIDCFADLAVHPKARDRVIADSREIVRAKLDIIIGSWCGKRFRPDEVLARPGWAEIPAVRDGQIYEIPSSIILQPGPAALTEGVAALHAVFKRWLEVRTHGQSP